VYSLHTADTTHHDRVRELITAWYRRSGMSDVGCRSSVEWFLRDRDVKAQLLPLALQVCGQLLAAMGGRLDVSDAGVHCCIPCAEAKPRTIVD
jgi:hypothetical protein